jgi:hypothetical protein
MAYLVGCCAGPTGLMALTTGRYCAPQPAKTAGTSAVVKMASA